MSLLTLCQNAIEGIPLSAPSIIVNNSNETAKLALRSAQQAGQELMRRYNWLALVTEHTFTTVASQEDYDLPADFSLLVNSTLWDRSNYEHIRGPMSPQAWQEYKSSVLASTNTVWKRYRIRNVSGSTKYSIHPTPDSADNLVFEYVSTHFCKSSGGTGQASWQADTDVGVLDEYLLELGVRWRMLRRMGLSYDAELAEYKNEVSQAIARDGGAPTLSVTPRRHYHLIGPSNVPETGYGT